MYRELVRRNIIIIALSLVAFFLLSLYVTNFVNRNNSQKQLLYLSDIINNKIPDTDSEQDLRDTVNDFCKDQKWLGIVVCNSLGTIIINSGNDASGEGTYGSLTTEEVARAAKLNDDDRVYIYNSVMYYVEKVNDDIIVRTSLIMSDNVNFILYSAFFLLIVLIVVLSTSIVFTRKASHSITQAFDNISGHLRTIREGGYHDIVSRHKYEEVEHAYVEINAVNKSLAQYMEKLRYERDKANFILSNIGEGIIIIGLSGKVYTVNDYARDIFSISQFIEGCDFKEIIADEQCQKMLAEEILGHKMLSFDYFDKAKDKIYQVNLSAFSDSANVSDESLVAMVLYDVTTARREEKDKAEFISNASHELRTPITSIRGFSELLLSGMVKDKASQDKYIDSIHQEAIIMKDTVDEMLYLSKLNYWGESTMEIEDVELFTLAQRVAKKYDEVNSYGVTVKCLGEPTNIRGNKSLLEHMVDNLVSNAVKYNKDGGSVVIEVKSGVAPYVKVSDTGQGIEDKDVKRLFERFYRVDNSRCRETGGTGLGLTIVSKICSLHNAEIKIDSVIGEGTTFTVTFKGDNL